MNWNRELSRREKVVILVLAILLLVLVYYRFVYSYVQSRLAQYNTSALESELLVEQGRAQQISSMEAQIRAGKGSSEGIVAPYNNLKQEIRELNRIFRGTENFNMDFKHAYADGTNVRRNISITFAAGSMNSARSVINELYGCRYKCLIRNIQVSRGGGTYDYDYQASGGSTSSGSVSVTLDVTFFETTYGASSTSGLTTASDQQQNQQ